MLTKRVISRSKTKARAISLPVTPDPLQTRAPSARGSLPRTLLYLARSKKEWKRTNPNLNAPTSSKSLVFISKWGWWTDKKWSILLLMHEYDLSLICPSLCWCKSLSPSNLSPNLEWLTLVLKREPEIRANAIKMGTHPKTVWASLHHLQLAMSQPTSTTGWWSMALKASRSSSSRWKIQQGTTKLPAQFAASQSVQF